MGGPEKASCTTHNTGRDGGKGARLNESESTAKL
jgi:hypothetical protein